MDKLQSEQQITRQNPKMQAKQKKMQVSSNKTLRNKHQNILISSFILAATSVFVVSDIVAGNQRV